MPTSERNKTISNSKYFQMILGQSDQPKHHIHQLIYIIKPEYRKYHWIISFKIAI